MTLTRQLTLIQGRAGAPGAAEEEAAAGSGCAVRVAFATSNRRRVDQHFGAAEGFAIYRVGTRGHALETVAEFGRLGMDGNEDKLGAKIDALEGCVAVYCRAVGASAIAQLRACGIQPLKLAADTPIERLLAQLGEELRSGPSAWLQRAIDAQRPRATSRFDAMAAEEWRE